ncbi:MAG: DUF5723 family protein [Melioribacteraceae bacterium]|nr:DUF5723 family protein [Melioribacteraceae bacterium]MCF8353063.1 DUF5723 family protein [Melioribacteraceae bacterium]MCF8392791.1 DUF5723 family protein [Melioribacteraceae bacterium]MCF8418322.1 DUF5723 family protein [Melioribacteraceae bacterium]
MKKLIFIISIFLILTQVNFGQVVGSSGVVDPISAGMANTYTSNSRGVYALGKNPANLMFGENYELEFATVLPVPNFYFLGGADFMTIGDFNYFFGGVEDPATGNTVGRYLDQADKDRLRSLFESGGIITMGASIPYLQVLYRADPDIGAFAFSISDNFSMYVDFPEGIIDLMLEGNPIGEEYSFDGSVFRGNWIREYSLSYARDFNELFGDTFEKFSAGVTLKILSGIAMIDYDEINTTVRTLEKNIIEVESNTLGHASFSDDFGINYDFDSSGVEKESNMGAFPSTAGSGVGFGFGFTAQVDESWTVALAMTEIGSITWSSNVAEYSSSGTSRFEDITDEAARDSIVDKLKGSGKVVDEISTTLPTTLRMGATFQLHNAIEGIPGTMAVSVDYNQGFNNRARNSTKPRVSLGVEWRPWDIWPIRTGVSFGGRDGASWAFGTGIDAGMFEFNFGAFHFSNLLAANNATQFSLSLGTRWRF